MADLISREAAIDAIVSVTVFPDADYIKNLCENPSNSEDWLGGVCEAINAVEDVNAVDVVPVVRCRDCKYFMEHNDGQGGNCNHLDYDGEYEFSVAGDWFCADGERRDSE
jgi:hypothetical protein